MRPFLPSPIQIKGRESTCCHDAELWRCTKTHFEIISSGKYNKRRNIVKNYVKLEICVFVVYFNIDAE